MHLADLRNSALSSTYDNRSENESLNQEKTDLVKVTIKVLNVFDTKGIVSSGFICATDKA